MLRVAREKAASADLYVHKHPWQSVGMGAAVAARLMEVGHEVTVWNRTPEKTKPLADAGAKVAVK